MILKIKNLKSASPLKYEMLSPLPYATVFLVGNKSMQKLADLLPDHV
jgi:hypothetical protein